MIGNPPLAVHPLSFPGRALLPLTTAQEADIQQETFLASLHQHASFAKFLSVTQLLKA